MDTQVNAGGCGGSGSGKERGGGGGGGGIWRVAVRLSMCRDSGAFFLMYMTCLLHRLMFS